MIDKLGLRANETDKYLVDRLRDALQILKRTDGEQQRLEYRVVLTAIAPQKVGARQNGMGREYENRLNVTDRSHCSLVIMVT